MTPPKRPTFVPIRQAPTRPGRRRAIHGLGVLCVLLTGSDLVFGASIVAVRVWPANICFSTSVNRMPSWESSNRTL